MLTLASKTHHLASGKSPYVGKSNVINDLCGRCYGGHLGTFNFFLLVRFRSLSSKYFKLIINLNRRPHLLRVWNLINTNLIRRVCIRINNLELNDQNELISGFFHRTQPRLQRTICSCFLVKRTFFIFLKEFEIIWPKTGKFKEEIKPSLMNLKDGKHRLKACKKAKEAHWMEINWFAFIMHGLEKTPSFGHLNRIIRQRMCKHTINYNQSRLI